MQLSPYLFFDGNCEEALTFYASVLNGRIAQIMRMGDSPGGGDLPPEQRNRVMHATVEAPGVSFMASDGDDQARGRMHRAYISVASEDAGEGKRVFDALAAGGEVVTAYEKQFWGASFGMLVDRYGIQWMVNAG